MFSGSQQPPLSCPRSNVPSDTNLPVSPLSFLPTFSLFISLVLKYKIIPSAAVPVSAQSRNCWSVSSQLSSRLVISFINPFLATTGAANL